MHWAAVSALYNLACVVQKIHFVMHLALAATAVAFVDKDIQ
jgi:hypothetical protein